jgi:hypothetical protein
MESSTGIAQSGGLAGRIASPIGVAVTIGGLTAAGERHPHPKAAVATSITQSGAEPLSDILMGPFLTELSLD